MAPAEDVLPLEDEALPMDELAPVDELVPADELASVEGRSAAADERPYISWSFLVYEEPDFRSEVRGQHGPQPVRVLQMQEDGWAQISTWNGNWWVYLSANRRYVPNTVILYDAIDGNPSGRIDPQVVRVLAQAGYWLEIETWRGPMWIRLLPAGQHHISWQFVTYLEPSFLAPQQEILDPQTVTVLLRQDNGWARIETDAGERWVYLNSHQRFISRETTLFDRIGGTAVMRIGPQVVRILQQDGNWFQISTWLGPMWMQIMPPRQPGEIRIALTFDDGPGVHTERLLNALQARNVSVTFFVTGQQVTARPEIAARIVAEGHEIANHSYSHPNLAGLGAAGVRSQLNRTNQAIYQATGITPTTFRPPFGAHNATVRSVAAEFGFPVILWSVDTRDWESRNVNAIMSHFVDRNGVIRIREGDVILMHDIHPASVDAAIRAVDLLLAHGFTFVTVSELLEERHGPLVPGRVYTR